ncbi:MAG TPA: hypothetical protein VIN65_10695 [Candidatus Dormibacteraeota bacterium]|jgi:hypothetical protein
MKAEPIGDALDFRMEVFRGDGLHITATVHVADNGRRLVCRALELSTEDGQIDSHLLRALSLATLCRRAADHMVGRIPLPKPRSLTDEFLAQVAVVYRQAIHRTTWTAVAELQQSWFGEKRPATETTARRWIALAREAGHLRETIKGRKGG